ncbi:odorant receptor 65a-like [Drosophila obscura]|uniref:odorant receptor 65a-like n=1 Tax=Drosophila obscura TaxID=7282 RepID=UPI001BB2484E|nr:odorant receptor 65a-like [Drosophila obscura]
MFEVRRDRNNNLGLKGYWIRLIGGFLEARTLLNNPEMVNKHTTTYYARDQMKALGLYMNTEEHALLPLRRAWHVFLFGQLSIMYLSMIYGLLDESLDNVVEMGRDLAFLIGMFFIIFKMVFFSLYADEVDEIIDALEQDHHAEVKGPGTAINRATKRRHFLLLMALDFVWTFAVVIFIILLISTPLWADQTLPFHVAFPFELHDPSKHPIAHFIIYMSQTFSIVFANIWLVATEGLSVCLYSQVTTALSVLCVELRHLPQHCTSDGHEDGLRWELKRLIRNHQSIILIVDRCNQLFHGPLIMQMIVNFMLVSLSVFEAMMARHDPKVAAEFMVLMILALGHLSLWSKFGDLMSQESMEVAMAAYEAYEPNVGSNGIHQDIRFIIARSQQPLIMRASPFPEFNLINYMAILHQCYVLLTLLLNTLD